MTIHNRYLLIDEETRDLTERGQTIIDHSPVERFSDPEDLVNGFIVACDGSEFVQGTVLDRWRVILFLAVFRRYI